MVAIVIVFVLKHIQRNKMANTALHAAKYPAGILPGDFSNWKNSLGSTNNTNNSVGRKWQYIFDRPDWAQKCTRTNENYRNQ